MSDDNMTLRLRAEPLTINITDNGVTVGCLTLGSPITFTGDADASAKVFFENIIERATRWQAEAAKLEAALEAKTRELKILQLRLAEAKSKGPFWRWIAQDALNNECYALRELKKQDERLDAALLEIKNLKESLK